jgi:hypothetical protein
VRFSYAKTQETAKCLGRCYIVPDASEHRRFSRKRLQLVLDEFHATFGYKRDAQDHALDFLKGQHFAQRICVSALSDTLQDQLAAQSHLPVL